MPASRCLDALPKAHLHLHFTGSMRPQTLADLAAKHSIRLPETLREHQLLRLTPDERGWFRFQRMYDAARNCVRDTADMQRLILEAAADDAAEGSRRLELQVDPTSYAPLAGGLTPALECVLDAAASASASTGCEVGIIVAASRIRHPLDARTLARLAAQYAGDGPGQVIGFGLSNDERRGDTAEFETAFAIAARAGLISVPHAGELQGPANIAATVKHLHPQRLGHGVRSAEDPRLLEELARAQIALEVCPSSNVALGVYPTPGQVPLRTLMDSGVPVALGADDPLLFGPRLTSQYRSAREAGFSDAELAALARQSIQASLASPAVREKALRDIDAWLEAPGTGDAADAVE